MQKQQSNETELFHEYAPLVRGIAIRKFNALPRSARVTENEIISDAHVGFLRAVRTFDPAHGVPLGAYITRIVSYEIAQGLRDRNPGTRQTPQPEPEPLPQETFLAARSECDHGRAIDARSFIAKLPMAAALVLYGHYFEDLPLKAIAALCGRTESWAAQIQIRTVAHYAHL